MLAGIWRNWNACALLVGISNDAATMEKIMVVPQEIKLPYNPASPFLDIHSKELKASTQIFVHLCS